MGVIRNPGLFLSLGTRTLLWRYKNKQEPNSRRLLSKQNTPSRLSKRSPRRWLSRHPSRSQLIYNCCSHVIINIIGRYYTGAVYHVSTGAYVKTRNVIRGLLAYTGLWARKPHWLNCRYRRVVISRRTAVIYDACIRFVCTKRRACYSYLFPQAAHGEALANEHITPKRRLCRWHNSIHLFGAINGTACSRSEAQQNRLIYATPPVRRQHNVCLHRSRRELLQASVDLLRILRHARSGDADRCTVWIG